MAKLEEIEDFEELDAVLDKMRVLTMALWGSNDQDPDGKYLESISSFATDIVDSMEKLVEKNKPKPASVPVR